MKPLTDAALRRLREAAAAPDLTGTRYTVVKELGRGGMGVVYLAEDAELRREVALKVLHVDDASPELAERMRREARTLAQLEHPNIVPVYDFGELPDGRLFYVMKRVEGVRLDECLKGQAHLRDRLRLFEKICEAAAFAHARGVVHRDLKPANIMVGRFGEVLVMDWGLAQEAAEREETGRVMGTPEYMAPEQERGDEVDRRADIFALGRILQVFIGAEQPRALESVCARATAAKREDRYQSAVDLSADVLRYLDGLPVTAHRETVVELVIRFYNNNRTLLLLFFTYAVVRFLVFFWARR